MIEIRAARMADSKRLAKTMETYPYLVIVRDGEIAGYAYAGPFNPREAYQWSCEMTVYLDPHQRGRGLGKKLYQAMEEALRKMGICLHRLPAGGGRVPDD